MQMDPTVKGLKGKCLSDEAILGKNLLQELVEKEIQLITGIRKNMKNYLMPLNNKILLRK